MPSTIQWNRLLTIFMAIALVSCASQEQKKEGIQAYHLPIPVGFPEMDIPDDNPMTVEAVALGKRMFFDPIMSNDYTVSCASCHLPELAYADTVAVSNGVHDDRLGRRNSPSLANVGYLKALFSEGGVPSLELQVLAPLGEQSEMDLQIRDAVSRMKEDSGYVQLSRKAYGREVDPWVITHALAAFERTLISGDSPFDRYFYQGIEGAISKQAKNGWEHFQELNCTSCHTAPLFTDQGFYNIGLYEHYEDSGRGRLHDDPRDRGKFKVPSLRNVALTAPYMHDGSMETLMNVLEHFASGGAEHPNKSPLIAKFELDEETRNELIAFLESLTDETFVSNEEYRP